MKIEHKPDEHHYKNDDGTTIMRIKEDGIHFSNPSGHNEDAKAMSENRLLELAGIYSGEAWKASIAPKHVGELIAEIRRLKMLRGGHMHLTGNEAPGKITPVYPDQRNVAPGQIKILPGRKGAYIETGPFPGDNVHGKAVLSPGHPYIHIHNVHQAGEGTLLGPESLYRQGDKNDPNSVVKTMAEWQAMAEETGRKLQVTRYNNA